MKILVINPNTTASMTHSIRAQALIAADDRTYITAINPDHGPTAIETIEDEQVAVKAMLEALEDRPGDSYDAIVVACYSDPGVAEIRLASGKPVVGIAEASMLVAASMGPQFGIVVAVASAVPIISDLVDHYGLTSRLTGIYASGLSVLEIANNGDRAKKAIAATSQTAIDSGAAAITLGCAAMSPLAPSLSTDLRLPVIDGVQAAVKLLQARQLFDPAMPPTSLSVLP